MSTSSSPRTQPILPQGEADDFRLQSEGTPVSPVLSDTIQLLAGRNLPVLLVGEAGTGRRGIARRIHEASPLAGMRFEEVDCSGLSGSFFQTDGEATDHRRGWRKFSGSLYLNEIRSLTSGAQTKLMQALAAGVFDDQARLIASTSRGLEQDIRQGQFREDLYYRLAGLCLNISPLRHRRDEIPALTNYFLCKYSILFGRSIPTLSATTLRFLNEHEWPGNVGELEDVIKTIVAIDDERVALAALRSAAQEGRRDTALAPNLSLKAAARAASNEAEKVLIERVLARTRWNRKRAAEELQISYKALLYKLKQFGLEVSQDQEGITI